MFALYITRVRRSLAHRISLCPLIKVCHYTQMTEVMLQLGIDN